MAHVSILFVERCRGAWLLTSWAGSISGTYRDIFMPWYYGEHIRVYCKGKEGVKMSGR